MNKFIRRPFFTSLRQINNYSTVDVEEVEKFKRLSCEWWNDVGEMKVLRNMNEIRIPFIRDGLLNLYFKNGVNERMVQPLSGLKILDVGCGGGFVSEPLARLGAKVTGIDVTEEVLNVANYHKSLDHKISDRIEYVNMSVEDFVLNNSNNYDAVVSSEVIDHITNKKKFLRACVKIIKPGGSIFMTTLRKVPRGTHEFSKLISSHQLARLLEEEGCSTIKVHGMILNPCTDKWMWASSDVLHYALHAIKNLE